MLPDWPRAWGGPAAQAVLRQANTDFQVEELFEFLPSGDGEFDWLLVEKSGDSTEFVARALAKQLGLPARAVGYSGLKDRHALTRQWYCLHRPGRAALNWSTLLGDNWRVVKGVRHRQKLRRGSHRGNRFVLILNEVVGDRPLLNERLSALTAGFPNYFGEQRFGIDGGNIAACRQWFEQGGQPARFEKGLYLSSARSWLFNQVLAQRVFSGTWDKALDGEVLALRDSGSVFSEPLSDEIVARVASGDLHPTGPLFGAPAKISVAGEVAALEQQQCNAEPVLCAGLAKHGLKMERRALRVLPKELSWEWLDAKCLRLEFALPRGCFATALVRELVTY